MAVLSGGMHSNDYSILVCYVIFQDLIVHSMTIFDLSLVITIVKFTQSHRSTRIQFVCTC